MCVFASIRFINIWIQYFKTHTHTHIKAIDLLLYLIATFMENTIIIFKYIHYNGIHMDKWLLLVNLQGNMRNISGNVYKISCNNVGLHP